MRVVRATALLLLVAALVATAQTIPRGDLIHHHSLEPPFVHDWWEEGVPHWDIGGDAVATTEMIRLTPNRPSRFGWIWNTQKNDNPWWEVRMQFHVRSKRNPGADGLAFWYASEPYVGSTPGPLFGMPADFKGIGVIFDSYDNDLMRDNPATLFVNNVKGERNQWNTDNDLIEQATFRCMFEHRNTAPGDAVEMIMQYYNRKLTLRLRTLLRAQNEILCGQIEDIELPMDWVFGATATTGGLSDNHDISLIEVRPLGDPIGDPHLPQKPKKMQEPKHFDHADDARQKEYWQAKDQVKKDGPTHHEMSQA